MSKSQINSEKSGIILAAVLILLGVITALVLQVQVLARSGLNLEKTKLTRIQLRETAGDGVWRALNLLAADQNLLVDHTNEEWAAPMRVCLPNGIDAEMIVIDENRFIDANMLASVASTKQQRPSTDIVHDLIAAESSLDPDRQTQIIKDWVDKDSDGGYETDYYRRLQKPAEAANTSMESREELLWLMETTTNPAANELTILPTQAPHIEPININTAGRPTLLAVFGANNAGLVERIIRSRNAAPLLTLGQIIEPEILQRFASYLSVRSSIFSIHARAKMGASAEEVYCLAKRDQAGNIQVLRWVER